MTTLKIVTGLSALAFFLGLALAAYAKSGDFHPHGFEALFPLLGGIALIALGLVGIFMCFLIYTLPRS